MAIMAAIIILVGLIGVSLFASASMALGDPLLSSGLLMMVGLSMAMFLVNVLVPWGLDGYDTLRLMKEYEKEQAELKRLRLIQDAKPFQEDDKDEMFTRF